MAIVHRTNGITTCLKAGLTVSQTIPLLRYTTHTSELMEKLELLLATLASDRSWTTWLDRAHTLPLVAAAKARRVPVAGIVPERWKRACEVRPRPLVLPESMRVEPLLVSAAQVAGAHEGSSSLGSEERAEGSGWDPTQRLLCE